MGRPHRVAAPGSVLHAGSRGNNGRRVFEDRLDYAVFLDRAAAIARRFEFAVHAYCLMPNHFHFLVQLRAENFSAAMQLLIGGHSRIFNRRHGCTGHVFRNRFYGGVVERDPHLLETARYIELNPVRAGICAHPEQWPWSSFRANAGLDFVHPLLAESEVVRMLGSNPATAARAYLEFVRDGYLGSGRARP